MTTPEPTDPQATGPGAATPGVEDPADAGDGPQLDRVGLADGQRYRCTGCGNVTRFDVEVTERARRFWHADLAGGGRIESEERETTVHAVRCRWCGATEIAVEDAPAGLGGASAAGG